MDTIVTPFATAATATVATAMRNTAVCLAQGSNPPGLVGLYAGEVGEYAGDVGLYAGDVGL